MAYYNSDGQPAPGYDDSPESAPDPLTFRELDKRVDQLEGAVDEAALGESVTASGDGVATVFLLSHSLGAAPSAVNVTATSVDASADFYVSNKTSTDVEVTYGAAPASGTDNLAYDLVLVE